MLIFLRSAALLTLYALASQAVAAAPAAGHSPATAQSIVSRGQYVALAADCNSCHTAPGGKPFAGGDELKTPFGSIYGPNITQDRRTGIGTWTKADFVRALRLGVRKDGGYLYPAMPYIEYTMMTDADVDALWAYLQTIAPVSHSVPPPEKTFRFPFNFRPGIRAWQAIYFKPHRWEPTPGEDAQWNRGAYLIQAVAHCGECHTPKNVGMAPEAKYQLTGAALQGWFAPNISSDPNSAIKKYDVAQLVQFLKTGDMAGNGHAFGPMAEAVHDSLRHLDTDDLTAMAVYLKDQKPVSDPTIARAVASPEELAIGKQIYENNCSSCHHSDGKGMARTVPALAGNTAVTAASPDDVIMAILEGFGPQGTWGAMGSFAHRLTDEQIADVANYVRTAWNNHGVPNAQQWEVGNARNYASIPKRARQPDLICPLLPANIATAALKENPDTLRAAGTDHATLVRVVRDYTTAKPNSSPADVIEALTEAYCRAVVGENVPLSSSGGAVANFSQQVAIVLTEGSDRPTANNTTAGDASGRSAMDNRPD
jgi:mono/diheme cytochrome c family protein